MTDACSTSAAWPVTIGSWPTRTVSGTLAEGFGNLTVHEVATDKERDDLAYLSYYNAGLRVIQFGAGGITEVGHGDDLHPGERP